MLPSLWPIWPPSIPRMQREYLKAMELPKDDGAGTKKVMRYSSTYRHTGLIGH